jgi:pimeloyl-ACP methyl ester carboxylesterase
VAPLFKQRAMPSITSKDGTVIAYDKVGNGPAIILVNGALGHRGLNGEQQLASLLASNFTVFFYDRRGRGESSETKPYSVEGEIADLEALINEAGGEAFVHGTSAGAALALLAAQKLGRDKILKLSLYEPPYDAYLKDGKNSFSEVKTKLKELVAAGKPGDAIEFFFESIGTPEDAIQGIKQSPAWSPMEKIGHTLVYDFEILGTGIVPASVAKNIDMPAQILDGSKSYEFMHHAASSLSKIITNSKRKTLKDQTHQASAEVLAPVLSDFFSRD